MASLSTYLHKAVECIRHREQW